MIFPEYEWFKAYLTSIKKIKPPWKDFGYLISSALSVSLIISLVLPQAGMKPIILCGVIYAILSYVMRDLVHCIEKDIE